MPVHETRFRVRYAETDQMGIVYHANYLVWMEIGRIEYCRAAGVCYKDMEVGDGVLLAVAEAQCRFAYPARYDEEIAVQTRVEKAHSRLIVFSYRISRAADDKLLATGETKHVFCGPDMQRRKLPEKYWDAFGVER